MFFKGTVVTSKSKLVSGCSFIEFENQPPNWQEDFYFKLK